MMNHLAQWFLHQPTDELNRVARSLLPGKSFDRLLALGADRLRLFDLHVALVGIITNHIPFGPFAILLE